MEPRKAFVKAHGAARGERTAKRFEAAAKAFRADRHEEARKILVPIVKSFQNVADVRELYGLVLYRLGNFEAALEELEAFRELSGTTEQHPVLADCHRALKNWTDVDALWEELGEVSPDASLVTEGRIVVAGAMADRGEVPQAIMFLEKGWKLPKRPQPHHLRRAYALADLFERAGRKPRARELFAWVQTHDPDLADVTHRATTLN